MSTGPPPPGYWQPPAGGPPPWRPPPEIDKSLIRPRTLWYYVAALLFAACMIGAIALGYVLIKDAFGPLTRFTAPGSVEVTLKAGEGRSVYEQLIDRAQASTFQEPRCEVRGLSSASRPGLSDPTGSFQLDRNGRAYVARLNFEAPVDDRYRVACRGSGAGTPIPLAVGPKARVGTFVARIFGAIGLGFASFILGAAIAVPTLVMRNKHRQRLEQEAIARGA